jgi:cation transport ATPase
MVQSDFVNTLGVSRLVIVGLAVGVVVFIGVAGRRRAAEQGVDNDDYSGRAPTEAEVQAAEESIRVKTAESVRRAKATLVRSVFVFLCLLALTVPFMAGMPMNSFFQPWGQLLLIACYLALAFSGFAFSGFLTVRSYKRSLEKWMASLHEPD